MKSISLTAARRLAIFKQHLAGPQLPPNPHGIRQIIKDIGCLQIDPINVVIPSQFLVLWSRLGHYDKADVERLLWTDHALIEDWAHCTSIVPIEDYPIFNTLKLGYKMPEKLQTWVTKNRRLRGYILKEIRKRGALSTRDFQDKASIDWESTGWTAGRNINQMLLYLWLKGKVMVTQRDRNQKVWDLTERVIPDWTPRERLSKLELQNQITEKALLGLGICQPRHIQYYYIRNVPNQPKQILERFKAEKRVKEVRIENASSEYTVPGSWYIHKEDLPLLDRLESDQWEPRTTLLSPFDNLIYDRHRIDHLFNFRYRMEIYVPKDKRQFGYYVLPILHDDQFLGRIDPIMNRPENQLEVKAIFIEPKAPTDSTTCEAVARSIESLGNFVGADEIVFRNKIPSSWKSILK